VAKHHGSGRRRFLTAKFQTEAPPSTVSGLICKTEPQ
jgi:hypothetical protein